MIPILFDKGENAFTNNGLGRLRECISCTVTEERNGIYECDFEYPIDGAHYDLIQCGRIIGVTHNDSDDIQPFDIVSYTKPINGIVSFHAVHISYRQSFLTVKTSKGINSLSDAFTMLSTSEPANPFSYETDKSSAGYLGASDGTPRSVRELLGGVEGSILDTYGGEYEFDRFNVYLHSNRGQLRDFTIRYGVNMMDYNDETDISETYNSVIPYWTDGTKFVVGDIQTSDETMTGRTECVPLDVSDRFENKPSKAQVDAMGQTVLSETQPHLPVQTITVSFVRLQDIGYEWLADLYRCNLCDSIQVSFPKYGMHGIYKIVKTEWNVLENKYESMELGALSTSFSEALGITNGLTTSSTSEGSKNIWYAECSTGTSTAAKVVSTDTSDFSLVAGNMVRVVFTNANSAANPTLNVDGTGAKNVRVVTTTSGAQYRWQGGEAVDFVYDGTYFLMVDNAPATTTYYGPTKLTSSTSSTSTTLAATASAVKAAYDLANKQTETVSISASNFSVTTGSISSVSMKKYGNVVQLYLSVTKTSATSAGSDAFEGTLNLTAYRPATTVCSASFSTSIALIATMTTSGVITLRVCGTQLPANRNPGFTFTYLI